MTYDKKISARRWIWIRIRIQEYEKENSLVRVLKKKNKKNLQLKKKFIKNYNLPISKASMKDVQATRKAFSPQKRTSSASKHEIS
jgi:hypothetical protein